VQPGGGGLDQPYAHIGEARLPAAGQERVEIFQISLAGRILQLKHAQPAVARHVQHVYRPLRQNGVDGLRRSEVHDAHLRLVGPSSAYRLKDVAQLPFIVQATTTPGQRR
jgi:hypothetical protein